MTNIRLLRIAKGISQEQLARLTGLSAGHVSRLERGRRSATPGVAKALAHALAVLPSDLFEERYLPRLKGQGETFWRPDERLQERFSE
jgi:transcriptional regulator with XRE-family HTH domain